MDSLDNPLKTGYFPEKLITNTGDLKEKAVSNPGSEILKSFELSSQLTLSDLAFHVKLMEPGAISWSIDEKTGEDDLLNDLILFAQPDVAPDETSNISEETQNTSLSFLKPTAEKVLEFIESKNEGNSTAFHHSSSSDASITKMPAAKPLDIAPHLFKAQKVSAERLDSIEEDCGSQVPRFIGARGKLVNNEFVLRVNKGTPDELKKSMEEDAHFLIDSESGEQIAMNTKAKDLVLQLEIESAKNNKPIKKRLEFGESARAAGIHEKYKDLDLNKSPMFIMSKDQMDSYHKVFHQKMDLLSNQNSKEDKSNPEVEKPKAEFFSNRTDGYSTKTEKEEVYTLTLLKITTGVNQINDVNKRAIDILYQLIAEANNQKDRAFFHEVMEKIKDSQKTEREYLQYMENQQEKIAGVEKQLQKDFEIAKEYLDIISKYL